MIEDYYSGIVRNEFEANNRAQALAESVFTSDNWDRNSKPTNIKDEFTSMSIDDLYNLLLNNGPVYVWYYSGQECTHLIIVTGVDLDYGIVYSNSPNAYPGEQTYYEFTKGYLGMPNQFKPSIKRIFTTY